MRKYARDRGLDIAVEVQDIGSGAKDRPKRDEIMKAARRREIDTVLVWKLDRWGRSLVDLVGSLKELGEVGVGFVSLTEALDLNTSTGRAMMGLLGVFAEFERDILRERVKAGIAHARSQGRPHGRPKSVALEIDRIRKLKAEGKSHSEIARQLDIGRTSVRRLLAQAHVAKKRGPKATALRMSYALMNTDRLKPN
jgi:putative DNA-invertase from lambdoid prophage Rac